MIIVRKISSALFRGFKRLRGGRVEHLFDVDGCEVVGNRLEFSAADAGGLLNDTVIVPGMELYKKELFQWENVADRRAWESLHKAAEFRRVRLEKTRFRRIALPEARKLWISFVEHAQIPAGWRNAGFYHCCFDLSVNHWSAPDWLWTNSALVPHFLRLGRSEDARKLSEGLLSRQLPDGGWRVRDGRDARGVYGIVGPNDAAYLCDHGMLAWYEHSGDERFLTASLRCADWIMHRASSGNLPYFGWNLRDGKWMTHANIVDIGFTSGLFCHLYRLLKKEEHLEFSARFLKAYVRAFYQGGGRFATALDASGRQRGTGLFMRGQAWALEGLLPFCEIERDPELLDVTRDTVRNVLRLQRRGGSWLHQWRPYGLQILSGDDSKGTPVLAAALRRSRGLMPEAEHAVLERAVDKAIDWCVRHTASDGAGAGGVFSWNPEGSLGFNGNVSAACIYSNAYLCGLTAGEGRKNE